MTIALGFLLPCLIYLALYPLLTRRFPAAAARLGLISAGSAFLVALISSAVVLLTLAYAPHWPGRTQIAWTGVEVTGQPLIVGGPREQALIAWPNESFTPSLRAEARGETALAVEVAGGGAFVLDEKRGAFLNGTPLPDGSAQEVGGFTIKVARSWRLWHSVEIVGEDGSAWASFYMPAALVKRERVSALGPLVEEFCDEGVRADAARMLKLERWAQDLTLLVTRGGELMLLTPEAKKGECELPCELSLFWPRRRLPVSLKKEGVKLRMEFRPPRQFVSPLKPAEGGGWEKLVVTGNPLPGDRAFFLPLGQQMASQRQEMAFKENGAGLPVFDAPGVIIGEGGAVPLPAHMQPAPAGGPAEKNITSTLGVHFPPHSLYFATVNDLPDYWLATRLVLFALLCYGVGLSVAYRRMPGDATRWVLYGLSAVVWNLLALRLLLAFRYALSPVGLDALAVKGAATALLGLTVVPGLILLFVRLRRDLYARPGDWAQRKRILGGTLVHFALLIFFGSLAYAKAPQIWANAPTRPTGWADYVWYLGVAVPAGYLFLLIFSLYKVDATAARSQLKAAKFFSWPLRVVESLGQAGARVWAYARDAEKWSWTKCLAALLLVGAFWAVTALVALAIGTFSRNVSRVVVIDTFVHDILVPFAFYWPLALLLVGAKLAFKPGEDLTRIRRLYSQGARLRRILARAFLAVAAAVAAAVFIMPVGVFDAGSLMAVLAILIPTALVMLGAPPRRWGALVALALLLCFVAVTLAFINVRSVSPYLPSVAVSRILVFKNYDTLQSYLPFEGRGHLQKLRDGYQHTWENQAMAHEGGYTGLGFGNAPTRRSQVRHDTIQYDSVYSFFIVSEFGLLGGAALLLLYAVPLALVLLGGHLRFDFGYAVATIVASAFLLEGLTHAGMNLNAFPFTGRDLPLLTVNSFTDLLRWALLFGFAAQAVLYRYRGADSLRGDAASLVSPPATPPPPAEPRRRYLPAAAVVAAVPVFLFVYIVAAGVGVARDRQLDDPFSWSGILDMVDSMARQGLIFVKEDDMTIHFAPTLPVAPGMLIEQERLRFNALPLEERQGEADLVKYRDRLAQLGGTAGYDAIMDELRAQSRGGAPDRRVSLFRILPPLMWDDGRTVSPRGGYRVAANRAFNSQLSFKIGMEEADFPRAALRDGQLLVGPAWVMGRWVQLYNPSPSVPWTAHLSGALKGEWGRLGAEAAASTYSRLTLDARLQEAAAAFAAEKGRALHDELLRSGEAQKRRGGWLPPRVAISVISLPTGEALALGGWPRMTAGRFWKRGADGREWVPSYEWAEREAPAPLDLFYGGDRNFEPLVMGSATKPLWATAVLRGHPGIEQRLQTRGPESVESDVFGIRLVENPADGWDTNPTGWINFKDYLAKSDNRYHVRLGFLGLAEKDGADVMTDGAPGSEKESLRQGPPSPWKMYPRFPPEINFSHLQQGPLKRLNDTPLARRLLNMYGAGVTSNFFDRRLSFWTKNAADDRTLSPDQEAAASVFEPISPVAPDLALDQVGVPRDYVTLLLGGGSNLWANVDFAAAFATCVTGRPVLAHVVRNDDPVRFLPDREEFTAAAQSVRPGLAAVVTEGTANLPELRAALPRQYSVYAKTGTLSAQEGARTTSRIVLAIIKWDGREADGKVKAGLVFSVVGERAGVRTSTLWLAEFLAKNRAEIERLLREAEEGK